MPRDDEKGLVPRDDESSNSLCPDKILKTFITFSKKQLKIVLDNNLLISYLICLHILKITIS